MQAASAVARVGGIPSREAAARHPLQYMVTWSFEHVLREYMVDVRTIQDGAIAEVKATSGRESFHFSECGRDEELECAITPGMPSFLYTHSHLESFSEKTIRWPGHWQAIDTLKECGLLDVEPLSFAGGAVRPRDFFLRLIEPRLLPLPGDEDVCIMWNSALGKESRADYFMWAGADSESGISAMARVTGSSAAVAARLLASGTIREKGIVAPEEGIKGDTYAVFMKEMERRGIIVAERITRYDDHNPSSDFGSFYPAQMKGVILSRLRDKGSKENRGMDVTFVDIAHDIPPQDVRAGAFALLSTARYFPGRHHSHRRCRSRRGHAEAGPGGRERRAVLRGTGQRPAPACRPIPDYARNSGNAGLQDRHPARGSAFQHLSRPGCLRSGGGHAGAGQEPG